MCDLIKIEYKPEQGYSLIVLLLPEDKSQVVIKCCKVLFFKVSNTLDDMKPPFVVDVSSFHLTGHSAMGCLEKAGYDWREIEQPSEVYQLHIEGGIVMDIFSSAQFVISRSKP